MLNTGVQHAALVFPGSSTHRHTCLCSQTSRCRLKTGRIGSNCKCQSMQTPGSNQGPNTDRWLVVSGPRCSTSKSQSGRLQGSTNKLYIRAAICARSPFSQPFFERCSPRCLQMSGCLHRDWSSVRVSTRFCCKPASLKQKQQKQYKP